MVIILIVLFIIITFYCYDIMLNTTNIKSSYLKHSIIWKSLPHEFNPSITLDKNNLVVVTRKSNKCVYNAFYMFLNTITNIFSDFDEDIIIYSENKRISLNIPLEDPRIYLHQNKYYILATYAKDEDMYQRFLILNKDFEVNVIKDFNFSQFNKPLKQKNWNFFADLQENLLLLTDIHPKLIIRKVNIDTGDLYTIIEHDTTKLFSDIDVSFIRCSTSFIKYTETTLLCAIHVKNILGSIKTMFLEIEGNYPYKPLWHSKIYSFFDHRVEFTSGLLKDNNNLLLSLGVGDYQGYVIKIKIEDIH